MKWETLKMKGDFKNWKFEDRDSKFTVLKYQKMWETIGKEICECYKFNYEPLDLNSNDIIDRMNIVFLLDCTSSMQTYISECKSVIEKLVNQYDSIKTKFSFVGYRDYKD